MKTAQDFKQVLRLNRLLQFEVLPHESQMKILPYRDVYEKLVKLQMPQKFFVVHTQLVVDFLNTYKESYGGFIENVNLFTHFPAFENAHCFVESQPDYVEVSQNDFLEYLENSETLAKLIQLVNQKV